MPDGRIGHAELDFGGALLILADEFPEIGHTAPRPGAGASVTLHLEVADVDAVVARAVDDGRRPRPPGGRPASTAATPSLVDPFGHRWLVPDGGAAADRPDPAAATATSGTCRSRCRTSTGPRPSTAPSSAGRSPRERPDGPAGRRTRRRGRALFGGHDRGDLVLCWRVDDVAAAVGRSAAGGGPRPTRWPGRTGTVRLRRRPGHGFYLWQPPADAAPAVTAAAARRRLPTLNVVDSARFRAFFGSVLGWRFTPGQADDGWNVEGTMPMTGLRGGHDRPAACRCTGWTTSPPPSSGCGAGGTATDVERKPYGITSECTDDQGMPFYLGQL